MPMRDVFNGLPEIVTLWPTLRNVILAGLPMQAWKAANDNWRAWPLIPFPNGCYAAC